MAPLSASSASPNTTHKNHSGASINMTTVITRQPTKKARAGLPIEVELALPFLSATEDLHRFASASKVCRDAARDCYQRRIKSSMWPIPDVETTNGIPKIFTVDKTPGCYVNPWWHTNLTKHRGPYTSRDGQFPLEFQPDGSWLLGEEEWGSGEPVVMPTNLKLVFPASHHNLFDNGDTEMVHFSVVDRRLLVILNRWTDRGEDEFNAEETRKQLFAVVYRLSTSPGSNASSQDKLLPLYCHKLTEPLDRYTYGSLDGIYFGNAQRSRNGQTVAVVTALPLGNEDNPDEDNYRETAQVTVFNVTATALEKRCYLEIPIGYRTNDSWLTMTINNGGELLSINTTDNELEGDYGDWRVYDLTTGMDGEAKVLVSKEEVEKNFMNHQFTPDNELLIILSHSEDEGGDPGSFFDSLEIPSWLAKRMVVVTARDRDYFGEDD